jgi:dGTPase
MTKKFAKEQMNEDHPKWDSAVLRQQSLYNRKGEIRSDFFRDYTRILHCTAYRRLKHKTQVFFATRNDHICTRIEHVGHVASVSYVIANELGLNAELTGAIAAGHDLGHAPFGHAGEDCLREVAANDLGITFWHEKNSLRFVDSIETLRDVEGCERNLDLTYAVRDGIICHCGEVNETSIRPRDEVATLEDLTKASEVSPYTWEGCVVKIADKISYLGRDIEDALVLKMLSGDEILRLAKILKSSEIVSGIPRFRIKDLTNTFLMHNFVIDLCKNSYPDQGIQFSESFLSLINAVKAFNYEHIYKHKRLEMYKKYARLIINSLYEVLAEIYDKTDSIRKLRMLQKKGLYPSLLQFYEEWLLKYMKGRGAYGRETRKYENVELYDLTNEKEYRLSIIEFISGMTDGFAIRAFNELASF